jgi:hypothetical protein
MTGRSKRLTGHGASPLLQVWTTIRLRVFLRAAAFKAQISQSEFTRLALWERIQKTLTEAEQRRVENEATREAQAQGQRK